MTEFNLEYLEQAFHSARVLSLAKEEVEAMDEPVALPQDHWVGVYLFAKTMLDHQKQLEYAERVVDQAKAVLAYERKTVDCTSDHFDTRHDDLDRLEKSLTLYEQGLKGEIPRHWKKYEKLLDSEYETYLRLKTKFE